MRKIEKANKTKTPKKAVKPTKQTNLPTKTKPIKSTTHDYYCCCAEKTKQGIPKGTKITQLTNHCKNNSGEVLKVKQQTRETEKKKILNNWKQIGLSLGKIIASA